MSRLGLRHLAVLFAFAAATAEARFCTQSHVETIFRVKVLEKDSRSLQDQILGLRLLEQALAEHPVPGVEVEKLETRADGKVQYPIWNNTYTLQRFLQDSIISHQSKLEMIDLIREKTEAIRQSVIKTFKIRSSVSGATDLGDLGSILVHRDLYVVNNVPQGSFYMSLQMFSFNPVTKTIRINFPGYFRQGYNPSVEHTGVRIRPDADPSIQKVQANRDQEILIKKNRREVKKAKVAEQDRLEDQRRAEVLRGYTAELRWLEGQHADQALVWSKAPEGKISRTVIEQIYQQHVTEKASRMQIQIARVHGNLSKMFSVVVPEHRERFRMVAAATLKLMSHPRSGERIVEAFSQIWWHRMAGDRLTPRLEGWATEAIEGLSRDQNVNLKVPSDEGFGSTTRPREDLSNYKTMQSMEAEFDVLARKTSTTTFVSEVDVAMTHIALGVPEFRVELFDGKSRIYSDLSQKVYAIGHRGSLDFQGALSRGSFHGSTRHYAIVLPKGFVETYGWQNEKQPGPSDNEKFLRLSEGKKLFQIHFEKATAEKGQVHLNLNWQNITIDGRQMSVAQFVRDHVIAVVEFDRDGRILDILEPQR